MVFKANDLTGTDGFQFGWCQVIDTTRSTYSGVHEPDVFNGALDTGFPYPPPLATSPTDAHDSPGVQIPVDTPTISRGTYKTTLTMWYICKPFGGVWVPLASFTWTVSFSFAWNADTRSGEILDGAPVAGGDFQPTTRFPTWTAPPPGT
jgi:hypothetical protein